MFYNTKNVNNCSLSEYSDDKEYILSEIEARNNKIGLWSDPNPIAPRELRKIRAKIIDKLKKTVFKELHSFFEKNDLFYLFIWNKYVTFVESSESSLI